MLNHEGHLSWQTNCTSLELECHKAKQFFLLMCKHKPLGKLTVEVSEMFTNVM